MTFDDYTKQSLRTAPDGQSYETEDLLHGCAGVTTEGGELMDIFKKHEFYGKEIDLVNLKEEVGDVLWYLPLLCRFGGFTLEEAAATNIAKLRKRYPERFTGEAAINRDTKAEREVLEATHE